jgi:archaeal flagellin FlaB
MISRKTNDQGFTGLEAAIVLIAFVVVAAVFSYVVLGAGFFTTQKSQETVYKGVEQATSNLQMIGQVYGIASAENTQIDIIQFNIGLAPGAPSLDLSKMLIVVTEPGTAKINQLVYSSSGYDATKFTSTDPAASDAELATISGQKQATIKFKLSPVLTKNMVVNIELRPAVGAALPFTRTAPATVQANQILY